eukprot:CAMPEP_0172543632 /NCGR_PEP_ID=MMETSP1067-20121228/13971_1 /TAXON_ID=265564 ORGANISM="Thalassiosira punctigera, Strain Tpunct2005C2" /NCGR_SAMPLE_ID=MMETSP1067 /ASSEMBLY_ACC=CAM_ASM_000444 /LENGTH=329 /DNA_ID=CAMNT_0013330081 /DNA_START=151 /DNA_END=1136 /DNA_ORIENTATION=-
MRKLSVPTLAAIHGKVIGGGLALSLAADWRVCSATTVLNYGNLPLGKSALMNLSLALPLTVGRALAKQVYLEDTVLNAEKAKGVGLVNHIEPSKEEAESLAHRIAESFVLSHQFDHGPVSYTCAKNTSHVSLENELFEQLIVKLKAKQSATADVGMIKSSMRKNDSNTAVLTKVWSIEEIEAGVEEAVRKVVSIDHEQIDHHLSLMDEGLDSLGTTELSDILQSHFGIELSSTFVFNNPTIASMTNHLHGLLTPETGHDCSETPEELRDGSDTLEEAITRPALRGELAIVGMACHFPGGVSSLDSFWEFIHAGNHSSTCIPFDRWDHLG